MEQVCGKDREFRGYLLLVLHSIHYTILLFYFHIQVNLTFCTG